MGDVLRQDQLNAHGPCFSQSQRRNPTSLANPCSYGTKESMLAFTFILAIQVSNKLCHSLVHKAHELTKSTEEKRNS